MKTWEMIKMLQEDTSHKFIDTEYDDRRIVEYHKGFVVYEDGQDFVLVDIAYEKEDRFILLPKSTDFMSAINSGKRIRSEFWEEGQSVPMMVKGVSLTVDRMEINGKWYIED